MTDSARRPRVIIGVGDTVGGISSATDPPGIDFRDGQGQQMMGLVGTDLHFVDGKRSASVSFKGVNLRDEANKTSLSLSSNTISLWAERTEPYERLIKYGQHFSVEMNQYATDFLVGEFPNTFHAKTTQREARAYVGSSSGQVDIISDGGGARVERGTKRWPAQ